MNKLTATYSFIVFVILIFFCQFHANGQQIYINEFLASNSSVYFDEFGESDDWVELYNPSSSSVNLSGMFLTDDITNTVKWTFPAGTTISGNGFLLIWCDNQDNQGPLHTNFKLGSSGEDIAIVASDGTTIIDSYTYGLQTSDISQGRESDGGLPWVFFATPSPEATNGGSNSTIAEMPIASHNGGHYNNTLTITLTTATSGATIRYTLDGSEPTNSSNSYSSPLDIDETTVLRARTFKSGMEASRTMTHTYLYNINHTLPIFCVSTDDDNFFGEEDGIYVHWDEDIEQPAHVELYEADGTFGFRQDLGVQVHGGFSQSYPHKGISFIAKNEYGNNKISYPLFPDLPFDEYGSFILRASGNDWSKTLFRDALASGLAREFDDVDPMIKDPNLEFQGYRPAIVYLNGEYFGIHNLREKLDWRYLKTHYDIPKEDADIVEKRDNLEHGTIDAWDTYFEFIEDADFTNPDDLAELETWIELDHFIDYFLINVFVDNNDWPDNNNKRWRLRQDSSKWRYFLYDMDRGFGIIPLSGDYNSGDWTSQNLEMVMAPTQTEDHNKEWSTLLLRKLMLNDGFRLKWINRMADQLNIMYTPERLIERIDQFEDIYTPEIDQHANKWWDTNYYATNVNRARIFANNRTEEVWNQFDDFYDIITDVVDLEVNAVPAAGGTIHLNTMNLRSINFPWIGQYFSGVDVPMYVEPNPGYIFSGWSPTSLGSNIHTTMNLNGDGNITANFILGSTQIGDIVINEINYHSPDTCDAGDWIELYNAGNQAVDISGWFLEDESGKYFNIPPNTNIAGQGYLVIVEDSIRFQNTHPTITNFIGGFGNSITGSMGLSNGGEWISINNADRSFMDTVRYDDKLPWPTDPDGQGPSLQLINPTLDNALPESWIASQFAKGTPGVPNQGVLYLGQNSLLCTQENITLDATYSPCFGCTYNWSTGATTAAISMIPPVGITTYSVTVTDSSGSTQTDQVTVERSTPFSLSHTQTNLVCSDDTNGAVDLTVSTTGNFTYQWTNGAITQDVNNLLVGSYTVTVTDALFCTQTQSINITAPPALLTNSIETEINCYGDLGAIEVDISGGEGTYQYLWSNGATTEDLIDLGEGIYSLTVTDGNNCSLVRDFELNEPAEITASFDVEHGCNSLSNGNIDVDALGGTGSFIYAWSNGVTGSSDDLLDLDAGIYTLTLTDDNGCTWSDATEVLSSSTIFGNAAITNTACQNENTGNIQLNVNGGFGPYEYDWSIAGSSSQLQNLLSGDYMVTITDSLGCETSETYTVGSPTSIDAEATIDNVSCFGMTDGEISTNTSGGNGNYSYNWSTGNTTVDIANLSEGAYTLTVTDGLGCSDTFSYQVTQPNILVANPQIDNINCFGDADGSIELSPSGGSGDFTFSWSTGATSDELSNLAIGEYSVTISDENNCTTTENISISQNSAIANIIDQTDLLCNNTNTGSISINTNGGEGPYEYSWNTGSSSAFIDNLSADNYTVTVTDNNNCTSVETVTLTEPDAIAATFIQTNISCNGESQGALEVNPSGGTGGYSYIWNTGVASAGVDDLPAGNYTVTITDNSNCSLVQSASILEPALIENNFNITNVSCNGLNNGQIVINSNGGIGPFNYQWSTGENGSTVSDLAPSNYFVTITDDAGCSVLETVTVTEPPEINLNIQSTNINCANESTGSIAIAPNGGNGDYTYQWNTGATTASISDLPQGVFEVTVSDAIGCSITEAIGLVSPSPILGILENSNLLCHGENTGSINLTTIGGVEPYNFNWSNGANSESIDGLSAGIYTITITDNNNCTQILNTTLSSPPVLEAVVNVSPIDCSGNETAAIELISSGGVGNFSYNWSNGNTNADLQSIGAGTYIVTISDGNGCSIVENISVSEPPPLNTSVFLENVICNGNNTGSINLEVIGGEGPYSYAWSNGQMTEEINDLPAGEYVVTLTDNNGCQQIQNIDINEPSPLSYDNFQLFNNDCNGANNGSITLNGLGGVGDYSYEWNNGSTQSSISDLAAGNYEVIISDGNSCTFSESFTISEPQALELTSTTQATLCFDETNGSVEINISGGTGAYQVEWSNGATDISIDNLAAGNYEVTVSDELNCQVVGSIVVNNAELITTNISTMPISCHDGENGSISLITSGGTAPYTFEWSNGLTGPYPTGLQADTYEVTITDMNNCTQTETILLEEPDVISSAFEMIQVNCFGDSTGQIAVNAFGGTPPYFFDWSTGSSNAMISDLPAGNYGLTITDANNCNFQSIYTVTENSEIEISENILSTSCANGIDGSIGLVVSGGQEPYEIEWSNGDTGIFVEALSAGNYTVTISDMLGCTTNQNYEILEPDPIAVTIESTDPQNGIGGSITVNFLGGGTAPYSITWNNGENTPTISDLISGLYSYTITDSNGCILLGDVLLTSVGIATIPKEAISIYPNPTTGLINIDSDFTEMEISVIDVLGRTVYYEDRNFAEAIWSLDLKHLETGLYFMRIETKEGERTERILLENR